MPENLLNQINQIQELLTIYVDTNTNLNLTPEQETWISGFMKELQELKTLLIKDKVD